MTVAQLPGPRQCPGSQQGVSALALRGCLTCAGHGFAQVSLVCMSWLCASVTRVQVMADARVWW